MMFRVTRKMESYNRVNSPFSADNVFRDQYTAARHAYGRRVRAYKYARARVRQREKLPAGTEFQPSFCHQFASKCVRRSDKNSSA